MAEYTSLAKLPPLQEGHIRFYLCRHGQTDHNAEMRVQGKTDVPLNERGRQQAELLAQTLRDLPLTAILSSNLCRAKQTAEIVRVHHPRARDGMFAQLNEMDYGEFEGKKISDCNFETIRKEWKVGNFSVSAPGGESALDVADRALKALDKIASGYQGGDHIAIVLHGRLLKVFIASAIHNNLMVMDTLSQVNTAINVVDWHNTTKEIKVVAINYAAHLPAEERTDRFRRRPSNGVVQTDNVG